MKSTDTGKRIASCSECPSTFKLVPPADTRYKYPREKPSDDDHIKRVYECDDEQHRNTIYWERDDHLVVVSASDPLDEARHSSNDFLY